MVNDLGARMTVAFVSVARGAIGLPMRRLHVLLIPTVALWYAASTWLPAIPFVMACVPVALEVLVYGQSWSGALRAIGVTRWHRGGFAIALLYLLPLFAFFPVFAVATGQALAIQPSWLALTAGAVLNNGINEEIMMRGFVFRRLREDRTLWRAAALSTVYFAAYHVPMIITAGPLVGAIGVVIAVPTGLLMAYVYERGDRTIWASALVHAGTNAPVFVFTVGAPLQPIATMLYLVTSIAVSSAIVVAAYRRRT